MTPLDEMVEELFRMAKGKATREEIREGVVMLQEAIEMLSKVLPTQSRIVNPHTFNKFFEPWVRTIIDTQNELSQVMSGRDAEEDVEMIPDEDDPQQKPLIDRMYLHQMAVIGLCSVVRARFEMQGMKVELMDMRTGDITDVFGRTKDRPSDNARDAQRRQGRRN